MVKLVKIYSGLCAFRWMGGNGKAYQGFMKTEHRQTSMAGYIISMYSGESHFKFPENYCTSFITQLLVRYHYSRTYL